MIPLKVATTLPPGLLPQQSTTQEIRSYMSRKHLKNKWMPREVWTGMGNVEDNEPGVYVVLISGLAVYVGSSNKLKRRLKQHGFFNDYDGYTYTPWGKFPWAQPVTLKVKYPKKHGAHLMLEYRLIRKLRPKFNIRGVL